MNCAVGDSKKSSSTNVVNYQYNMESRLIVTLAILQIKNKNLIHLNWSMKNKIYTKLVSATASSTWTTELGPERNEKCESIWDKKFHVTCTVIREQ